MTEPLSADHLQQILDDAEQLKTAAEVDAALDEMALQINERLAGTMPVVLSVMNGGLVMAGQLLTRLDFPLEQGYLHATRYRGELQGSRELQWQAPPSIPLDDRTVLILDDIFDEGHTLAAVVEACRHQGAKTIYTGVLVNKLHDRKTTELTIDFKGMDLEDRYLFGSGMDYRGYWRNASGIYALSKEHGS